jgi:hypothetical protein
MPETKEKSIHELKTCERCGKFHNNFCKDYCSRDCCLEDFDEIAEANGVNPEDCEERSLCPCY